MIALPINMPRNCHECDGFGISDVIGLNCESMFCSDERPGDCPLKAIRTYQKDEYYHEDEIGTFGKDEINKWAVYHMADEITHKAVKDHLVVSSGLKPDYLPGTYKITARMSIVEENKE